MSLTLREIEVAIDLNETGIPAGLEKRFVLIRDGQRIDSFATRAAAERRLRQLLDQASQPRLLLSD
jgi:hypothetical protein